MSFTMPKGRVINRSTTSLSGFLSHMIVQLDNKVFDNRIQPMNVPSNVYVDQNLRHEYIRMPGDVLTKEHSLAYTYGIGYGHERSRWREPLACVCAQVPPNSGISPEACNFL